MGKKNSSMGNTKDGGFNEDSEENRVWALGEVNASYEVQEGFSKRAPIQTTLGEEWHAFYDLRGVKYYYNFASGESMRRPHERFINLADQNADDKHAMTDEVAEIVRQISVSKADRKLKHFSLGMDSLARG